MIGTTLNQRFSLETELGRGGMGAVYRATDQILGRTVAIKVLKEQGGAELSRRIRVEAQILARLLHDNVVRLYDFGEADGVCFLVMEEVDGSSFLKRWRNLPFVERLRILAQVADALDYAHHQGVLHRDIKPGNVLLTSSDQPKLSDFGLSTTAEHADDTDTIRGTPHYMSPEQARGRKLDHRTDLYSLGVMLYECATGSVPFQGKSLAVLAQQINDTPERPRARNAQISQELETLILNLMDKDASRRPPSGAALAKAIREEIEREHSRRDVPTPGSVTAGSAPGADTSVIPARVASPAGQPAVSAVASVSTNPSGATPRIAREMLDEILAEPLVLSADERYLCGHYLAYLLAGARRTGLLLRRPLDPRNADRARLLLAMTSIMISDGSEASIVRAAKLLEEQPELRPSLNPIVVSKYIASRAPSAKKKFRQFRKQLLEASPYAQKAMIDSKGLLNPGLMPQTLDDLRKLAPSRTDVDDELVARWNRVAEVWRADAGFRNAVLVYATRNAASDPASFDLWPEVAYPLIERAHWQRRTRSRTELVWDNLCERVLHMPDAGVRLDRAIHRAVPTPVVDELDAALEAFRDEPMLEADAGPADAPVSDEDRLTQSIGRGRVNVHELTDQGQVDKGFVSLTNPDPQRFFQNELRDLWQEAIAAMKNPAAKAGHRRVPVGPYRLAVIPSIRGRSAGQVAIQGMPNKQVEMLTPSIRLGGSGNKPIIAVWVYEDNSLSIAFMSFKGSESYILWHAPTSQQSNFDDPGQLNHALFTLGLEVPDQLDRVLSKRFRPRNPV